MIDKCNETARKENLPVIHSNGTYYWLGQDEAVYYAIISLNRDDPEKEVAALAIAEKCPYKGRFVHNVFLETMTFDTQKEVLDAWDVAVKAIRSYRETEAKMAEAARIETERVAFEEAEAEKIQTKRFLSKKKHFKIVEYEDRQYKIVCTGNKDRALGEGPLIDDSLDMPLSEFLEKARSADSTTVGIQYAEREVERWKDPCSDGDHFAWEFKKLVEDALEIAEDAIEEFKQGTHLNKTRNEIAGEEDLPIIRSTGFYYWLEKSGTGVDESVDHYDNEPLSHWLKYWAKELEVDARRGDIEVLVAAYAVQKKCPYERQCINGSAGAMLFDTRREAFEAWDVAAEAIRDYRKKEANKEKDLKNKKYPDWVYKALDAGWEMPAGWECPNMQKTVSKRKGVTSVKAK